METPQPIESQIKSPQEITDQTLAVFAPISSMLDKIGAVSWDGSAEQTDQAWRKQAIKAVVNPILFMLAQHSGARIEITYGNTTTAFKPSEPNGSA